MVLSKRAQDIINYQVRNGKSRFSDFEPIVQKELIALIIRNLSDIDKQHILYDVDEYAEIPDLLADWLDSDFSETITVKLKNKIKSILLDSNYLRAEIQEYIDEVWAEMWPKRTEHYEARQIDELRRNREKGI